MKSLDHAGATAALPTHIIFGGAIFPSDAAQRHWAMAFKLLKQRQVIHLETNGENAGCWVMPAAAFIRRSSAEDATMSLLRSAALMAAASHHLVNRLACAEDSKVIVRYDGTVTHVGKEMVYQLWKVGLLT
jgi:hypothetical protein